MPELLERLSGVVEMDKRRIVVALLPAMIILVLTLFIAAAGGYARGLFLARSMQNIMFRFVVVTLISAAPVLALPRILPGAVNRMSSKWFFGQLVKTGNDSYRKLGIDGVWVFRPLQGIGLSLIIAEKLLELLDLSIHISHTARVVGLTQFIIGSALVSLFLSFVWALDDFGIRIYSEKRVEVHMAGSTVGIVLPLFTGILGATSLFNRASFVDALVDLLGISTILYSPFVFFALFHHEFLSRRSEGIFRRLRLRRIEIQVQ
jgi:hypothetical protein